MNDEMTQKPKAAHTPGPFETPGNNIVWSVFFAASVGQWQIWKGGVLIGTANTEANARLIAAAPELLDALKVVALTHSIADFLFENDPKALRQVCAAIARAEGREP